MEQWRKVLWMDESMFHLFRVYQIQSVKRRKTATDKVNKIKQQKLQLTTLQHGGSSFQVWGCISSRGVGKLLKIVGILTAARYKRF